MDSAIVSVTVGGLPRKVECVIDRVRECACGIHSPNGRIAIRAPRIGIGLLIVHE